MHSVVISTLSADRFSTYLTGAGRDPMRALDLYLWNAEIGSAFHVPIQALEVAMRNGMNRALTAQFGERWWESDNFLCLLPDNRQQDLRVVKARIRKQRRPLITGQIVAGLSLGFWVSLLQAELNPVLWSRHLRESFPRLPPELDREELRKRIAAIRDLRNRISHHEPIFRRDLFADYSGLMSILKWTCPATHDWVRPHCRVPALVRCKP